MDEVRENLIAEIERTEARNDKIMRRIRISLVVLASIYFLMAVTI